MVHRTTKPYRWPRRPASGRHERTSVSSDPCALRQGVMARLTFTATCLPAHHRLRGLTAPRGTCVRTVSLVYCETWMLFGCRATLSGAATSDTREKACRAWGTPEGRRWCSVGRSGRTSALAHALCKWSWTGNNITDQSAGYGLLSIRKPSDCKDEGALRSGRPSCRRDLEGFQLVHVVCHLLVRMHLSRPSHPVLIRRPRVGIAHAPFSTPRAPGASLRPHLPLLLLLPLPRLMRAQQPRRGPPRRARACPPARSRAARPPAVRTGLPVRSPSVHQCNLPQQIRAW